MTADFYCMGKTALFFSLAKIQTLL